MSHTLSPPKRIIMFHFYIFLSTLLEKTSREHYKRYLNIPNFYSSTENSPHAELQLGILFTYCFPIGNKKVITCTSVYFLFFWSSVFNLSYLYLIDFNNLRSISYIVFIFFWKPTGINR